MIDRGRRKLFTALSSTVKKGEGAASVVRPPYARDVSLFQTLCPQCESKACASACEEEIIVIGEDGTPTLDFSKRGCTFCDRCAEVCEAGVLDDVTKSHVEAKIEIDVLKCVAWHQVMCSSCKEPCLEDAIVFLGLFRPQVDMNKCTACGWCLSVCPTNAIAVIPPKGES